MLTREQQIEAVLTELIARRQRGEYVPDQDVIATNAELMPELGEQIAALRLVQRALGRAHERGSETVCDDVNAVHAGVTPEPNEKLNALLQAEQSHAQTDQMRVLTKSANAQDSHAEDSNLAISGAAGAIPGYEVLEEIHRGGQGVVYRATQQATKREVAIKVIREGPLSDPHDRLRFEREVQILASLNHPNIVTVHDSGTAAGFAYFVMRYIRGEPLDRYADRALTRVGRPEGERPDHSSTFLQRAAIASARHSIPVRSR